MCQLVSPTQPGPSPEAVVEWPLLLPGAQAQALEALARRRGLTVGRLIRLLIADVLRDHRQGPRPSA